MKQEHGQRHEQQDEVARLLTETMARYGAPTARAKARMWAQVRARAAAPARSRRRLRPLLAPLFVVVLVLGFVAGYGGVVVAEAPSVPGEPLYAIERKAETLWLSLTPNARRCEVELVLLERRVYEVSALLDAGQSAPDELWQEIDLLFLGVADGAHCRPEEAADLLPHLTAYRDRLQALAGRHPGVWPLAQTLETADAVVTTLQAEAAP